MLYLHNNIMYINENVLDISDESFRVLDINVECEKIKELNISKSNILPVFTNLKNITSLDISDRRHEDFGVRNEEGRTYYDFSKIPENIKELSIRSPLREDYTHPIIPAYYLPKSAYNETYVEPMIDLSRFENLEILNAGSIPYEHVLTVPYGGVKKIDISHSSNKFKDSINMFDKLKDFTYTEQGQIRNMQLG